MVHLGIEQIFTSYDNPKGNADTERMIRTIKEEVIWLHEFTSLTEAKEVIRDWIAKYNREYVHSALGYLSPLEFEKKFYQNYYRGNLVTSTLKKWDKMCPLYVGSLHDLGGGEGGGYFKGGLFLEAIRSRIPCGEITYINIENSSDPELERRFYENCEKHDITGGFCNKDVFDAICSISEEEFDLVLCSDAIYEFPHVLQYIPKMLKFDGIFAIITNSVKNLGELIQLLKRAIKEKVRCFNPITDLTGLERLIQRFSCENGIMQLQEYFNTVTFKRIEAKFIIQNNNEHICKAVNYINNKKKVIVEGMSYEVSKYWGNIIKTFEDKLRAELKKRAPLEVNRDDCILLAKKK